MALGRDQNMLLIRFMVRLAAFESITCIGFRFCLIEGASDEDGLLELCTFFLF